MGRGSFGISRTPRRLSQKRNGEDRLQIAGWEYAVKLDVLNGYALGLVGLFAACLYIAVVATGFAELMSRPSKVGIRKRRSKASKTNRRK
jgi:hypothetical protein